MRDGSRRDGRACSPLRMVCSLTSGVPVQEGLASDRRKQSRNDSVSDQQVRDTGRAARRARSVLPQSRVSLT